MNKMTKIGAAVAVACAGAFASMSANAWWNDDDYYDRWYGGPWYGGGYPGYGRYGYSRYGWYGYPGYGWGSYPGYGHAKTIIVVPQINEKPDKSEEPRLPK